MRIRKLLSLVALLTVAVSAHAEIRVYDFDDGTLQGFQYVNVDDEPYPFGTEEGAVGWKVSTEDVDLGENGWQLLQGSSVNGLGEAGNPQRVPNARIIPDPWDNRDCLGGLTCQTELLKSPTFLLDGSGPISVDIMGGQAQGERNFDPATDLAPEFPQDFNFTKSASGWQGFALYDVAADEYVRWGFPSFVNDGKERDGRDVWERVEIPQEDLADLANDGKTYRLDIFDSYLGGWGWIGIDTVQIPEATVTATWDGGDGNWADANWNGGMTANDMFGQNNGSDGAKNKNLGESIVIGGGATVNYDGSANGDFRIKQGSSLTITEGATWIQETTPAWSANSWTQMDLSELTIDGGTYRRLGVAPLDEPTDPESGGALIFGSWRGDDNFDSGRTPFPQTISIDIMNGGSLENEGQLWFGGWEDHPAGLSITMTINDGTLDLTGGNAAALGEASDADWVLVYGLDTTAKFTENPGDPKDEKYVVNFTGPGSITVDSAGIIAPTQVDSGTDGFMWTELDPISYQDLWDRGILQANGQSGLDGASFDEFFSVTGMLGMDDYMLTSLLGGSGGLPFDCNGDGVLDAADLACIESIEGRDAVLSQLGTLPGDLDGNGDVAFADFLILSANFGNEGGTYSEGNIDLAGGVDFADFLVLSANFGQTAAAQAVPEPSASLLLGLGVLGMLAVRKKR